MYKSFKFRIYPTESQRTLIDKNLGCARFIYNHYLTDIRNGKFKNTNECLADYTRNLKYQYPFFEEIDSIIIRKTLSHLEIAFKRYHVHIGKYPKYKSKNSKNSYSTTAIYREYKNKKYCNIELDLTKKEVKLPKLNWTKIKGYRKLNKISGHIINATISREPNRKYYVSLLYSVPDSNNFYLKPKTIVGIDLGIKKLITLSNGITIDNNKYILKYEKRIKKYQKNLSRKKRGSKNYYKCKEQLANLYQKLRNARNYYLHQITKQITDEYDIIVTEKLQTKNMLQNKVLSKNIQDAAFSEIIRQLQYKSKWKGKYFYQIDTYYPSTQTCSVCGKTDKKYKNLNERTYECCNCSNKMDRDLNASINIMFEGVKLHMNKKMTST